MSASYKLALIAAIVAIVEARFGQEQIPVAAVQALDGQFGNSGQASTLAGGVPGSLLGGADPCEKLRLADEIVATLGNDAAVISAAAGLVSAEQNFNPFASDIPNICGDASLPATEALRGITPLVDPEVAESDLANQLSASSLQTPFDAAGLSVADVMIAQGFANLAIDGTPNAGAGGAGGDAGADAGAGAGGNDNAGDNNAGNDNAGDDAGADDNAADDNAGDGCNAGNGNAGNNTGNAGDNNAGNGNAGNNTGNAGDNNAGNDNAGNDNAGNDNAGNDNAGGNAGNDNAGNAGAGGANDFGLCDPSIDFVFGRNGRSADEGTFGPVDAQIGGAEALNPNIITERVCDQLINVCEASDAARQTCLQAAAEVEAAGTRGPEIVDLFNNALGL